MPHKSTKKDGRKFDVSKALRGCQMRIPPQSKGLDMEHYIKRVSNLNGHVPTKYIINGKEVLL